MIRLVTKNQKIGKTKKATAVVLFTEDKNIRVIEKSDKQIVLRIGIGKKKEMTQRKLVLLARKIIQTAKTNKIQSIAIDFSDFAFPRLKKMDTTDLASLLGQNFEMANFEFNIYKTKPKEGWNEVKEIIIYGVSDIKIKNGFKKGQLIGEGVNNCRILANTPGGDMTPTVLGNAAKKAVKGTKVKVKLLGRKELQKLKMGAILGVAKGSSEEPKFIIMEYFPLRGKRGSTQKNTRINAENERPIVLVGKGVTFDTGGLNLKPEQGILGMHMDMSGGAAVIHTVVLAAKLKLKKNVIGLIPAVENMPSGSSYRPGDVLKSMSGKTIDVLNTDAEGRIILADALTYAKKYKPRLVVDVATLTGAALVALGQHASAIVTPDQKLENLFRKLGEESGDYVWPFPLWDEYEEYVKGVLGDVANIASSGNSRYGGVINGAMFLYQFVKDPSTSGGAAYPWVHIDMAPRMETIPSENLAKGAAGTPVRLLVRLLEQF